MSRRVLPTTAFLFASAIQVAGCETETERSPPAATGPTIDVDGGAPVASKCSPLVGEGTVHRGGKLGSNTEVWTAAASPHIVDFTLTIEQGQTLELEPCAVVRVRPNMGIYVRGRLTAEGAVDEPITIEKADAEPWTLIEANATGELRLVYTSIEGGGFSNGDPLDRFGMLDIRGDQEAPTQGRLHADHLALKSSASLGVLLREGGGFSKSSANVTITGSASSPVSTWARAAGTIPTGTYTGNRTDEILIAGLGTRDAILEDSVLADRGVPYHVMGSQLNVGAATGTTRTTLTIEPGVTLRFAKNASMLLDSSTSEGAANGAIRAVGTADKPIVFTSAEAAPKAGDWVGLLFEGQPDASDRIEHARISYAGANSGVSSFDCPSPANPGFSNNGAVVIYGGKPASAFIQNTTIEASAGDGIVRGWTGDVIDFAASNTFTGIAQCNQTYPKPSVGQCPSPAPCPQN